MRSVEKNLDRLLTCLRNAIRGRSYTHLEVQETLGWGRSYISQLVTKQKSLRIDQILLILNVIGVTPKDFFGEVFPFDRGRVAAARGGPPTRPESLPDASDGSIDADLRGIQMLFGGIVTVLTRKGLIARADLDRAIDRARSGDVVLPMAKEN